MPVPKVGRPPATELREESKMVEWRCDSLSLNLALVHGLAISEERRQLLISDQRVRIEALKGSIKEVEQEISHLREIEEDFQY